MLKNEFYTGVFYWKGKKYENTRHAKNTEQKRRLVNLIVSNSAYKDEKLDITLRAPFCAIMKSKEYGNWLPGTGLNRRPSD
jgi:hypothetical protein